MTSDASQQIGTHDLTNRGGRDESMPSGTDGHPVRGAHMTGMSSEPPTAPDAPLGRVRISDFGIVGLAAKRITKTEAFQSVSNDGGVQGVASIRQLLGETTREIPAVFQQWGPSSDHAAGAADTQSGSLVWYDTRSTADRRAEWRAFLKPSVLWDWAEADDVLIIFLCADGSAIVIVLPAHGEASDQFIDCLNLSAPRSGTGGSLGDASAPLSSQGADLLSAVTGVQVGSPSPDFAERATDACRKIAKCDLAALLELRREKTATVAKIARELAQPAPSADADEIFVAWAEAEEELYYLAEEARFRPILLERSFDSVADFLRAAMVPIQSRRARAGLSLEHHFRALLGLRGIPCAESGAQTEPGSTPDVLLPSKDAYDNPAFPSGHLRIVAIKRTCKDRWRQVLKEADRVDAKHLLTMDPKITERQAKAMKGEKLQVVIPRPVSERYSLTLQPFFLSLEECLADLSSISSAAK